MPDRKETSWSSEEKNIGQPSGAVANNSTASSPFEVEIPSISLPKGGGALKGIDEKFETNAVNGTSRFSVPLPSGKARGFTTALSISYNSGGGNSLFGIGWSLSLPSIVRKTDKALPQYLDFTDSDTYTFAGAEDLVPKLKMVSGVWSAEEYDSADGLFRIKRYVPRIEGGFSRIERWTRYADSIIHWRVISKENVTSIFGDTAESRLADPADSKKIFEWKLRFTYDDKGNCAVYEYQPEDMSGIDTSMLHNANRTNGNALFTNTYLKRTRCGNINPYFSGDPVPAATDFLFETVFDYGDHDELNFPFNAVRPWAFRADAYSDYRAGFEIRTCRLCKRVMLYHHIPELPGGSALVSSLDFVYDDNDQTGNFVFLKEVLSKGYIKHPDNSYTQNSLPPFSFCYQKHEWNKDVRSAPQESIHNLPNGITSPSYQWVDLYSEGINGILSEQGGGLFYKHNRGNGNFEEAKLISPRPSFRCTDLQLLELEADGTKYFTSYKGNNKGFFKITDDEWQAFRAFEQLPNIDFDEANTKLLDLNGDGRAEVLITENDVFTWYPSLGEKGFDSCRKVWQNHDEEKGPHIIFSDTAQSIFLSDMNGDGLTDIVRIKNGSVCYWPNLGYGKFGAKVNMDNAPWFDHDELFNASYISLADIDGSGCTDIIYLGKNQIRIWLNQHGNGFLSSPEIIDPFPGNDNLSQVSVVDFLGNGTACIIWSCNRPADQQQPLRYIDLMNGKKPHLMTGYKNNMGKEVSFEYKSSTWYYLQDKLAGTPWITKLPFPVHCLSKVTIYDRILKTRFASEYSYHHGYYDHTEREFRGFGRVEQKDAEEIAHFVKQSGGALNNTVEEYLHQPPVLTKTWFHTGAFINREKILMQFAAEYSQNTLYPENLLPEPELPTGLTIEEWRQALRACKGMILRKEVYALDGSPMEKIPYSVEQQNCLIHLLQPQRENKFACLLVTNSESITYHYERNLADPRISHQLILEIDEFSNVKKSATVVYKRKTPAFPEQDVVYTTYSESDFTNHIDVLSDYHTPVLYQSKLFEVTGLPAPAGNFYTVEQLKSACSTAASVDYHASPNGTLQKRITNWSRIQYRGDDGIAILPFGIIQSKGLIHQKFKAAFNQSQLNDIFGTKITMAALDAALTSTAAGGYVFADNFYWIPSATPQYDTVNFFCPLSFTDAFGNITLVQYDAAYHLFIERTVDPLGNELLVKKFNYRVLQPYQLQESNDNVTAIRFDEFGTVVKSFSIGKKGIDAGDEFDDAVVEISPNDFPSVQLEFHLSEWYLQSTSAGFDIDNYKPKPNFVKTVTRETHYHAHPAHQTRLQESFTYYSGSGTEVLKKTQAEPGEALQVNPDGSVTAIPDTSPNLRWAGTGRTIMNNKGNAVKRYEPYFSTSPSFDDEKEMVELGVTPIIQYDPLGRIIRTDFPQKTFTKTIINAWMTESYDQNDTVADSEWYALRITTPDPAIATPQEISAAQKAFSHRNTPSASHLDTMGRAFFFEADNVTEKMTSHIKIDIEGKELAITDALGRVAMKYDYDMTGRALKQTGIDAGSRWIMLAADNKPMFTWDERNHEFSFEYDALRRAIRSFVRTGNESPLLFAKIEYGELLPVAIAKANNLRRVAHKSYDQSGILVNIRNDFKANTLSTSRQFAKDFEKEIDWANPAAVALETEIFTASTEYDALNRPVKTITPHTPAMQPSKIFPSYNESGLLEKLEIRLRGGAETLQIVTGIDYDARGRREKIFYGNGTRTAYTYDKNSFVLKRLLTTRNNGAVILQDLNFTYDPTGNTTMIKDDAHADVFFDNEMCMALNEFEYDATYRLIKATGRKHAGQTDVQAKSGLAGNGSYRNHPFINHPVINPNDSNAFRNYTETYLYDKVGNMKEQKHVSKNSNWTRTFEYDNNLDLNNHLTKTSVNGDDYSYTYDPHGNMLGLETVMSETWNFMDHFKQADLGGGGTIFYVYDGNGQRVRKLARRRDGSTLERIYIGSFEIYRERNYAGDLTLERETLHVMDDKNRVAMIDTPTVKPAGNAEQDAIRYQYDNHISSAMLELNESAQLISYEEYFPFGATSYSMTNAGLEAARKRYRYTGKERDEETGLNYHGARYYALWIGRWTAADPIGIKGGINLYCYAACNPVRYNDPKGTQSGPDDPTWSYGLQIDSNGATFTPFVVAPSSSSSNPAYNFFTPMYTSATTCYGVHPVLGVYMPLGIGMECAAPNMSFNPTPTVSTSAGGPTSSAEPEPERSFWDRGGTTLVTGGIALGVGLLIVFSGPVGWAAALGGALLVAGGTAVTTTSVIQLGTSYSGNTTAEQDAETERALNFTLSLSSPGGLVGATGMALAGGDQQDIENWAMYGGMIEGAGTLTYGVGRMALTEYRFSQAYRGTTYNWARRFPGDPESVVPAIQDAYGLGAAADRVRPNPLFWNGREYIELSHTFSRQSTRGWEWLFNRPWNTTPMWATEHALIDPQRFQFTLRSFKAIYGAEQFTGVPRYLRLAPPWMLQTGYGGFRIGLSEATAPPEPATTDE